MTAPLKIHDCRYTQEANKQSIYCPHGSTANLTLFKQVGLRLFRAKQILVTLLAAAQVARFRSL
jgi:hypothetical protein